MKNYRDIKFRVIFHPNRNGTMSARVPEWIKNVHYDLTMVNYAFPVERFKPEPGVKYQVTIGKIGFKGTTMTVVPVQQSFEDRH